MARIVVLGTGTGVGKTFVSCALLEGLAASGASVIGLKPIETGVTRAGVSPREPLSDAAQLERAARHRPPGPHALFAFPEPISPHLAARLADRNIDLQEVTAWVQHAENDITLHDTSGHAVWSLVETAGGVFSPLAEDATNFDLARALEPAIWVLVAPDALGVLHDVRATLLAMQAMGRSPDHVVVNAARVADDSTGRNAAELERLGITRVTCTLGRNETDPVALIAALDKVVP